jgi:16S rRNA (uracil1498-N3)-methyltransferase
MHIFFSPHIHDNQALLSPEESAHCIRVLRLRRGDKIRLIDGLGGMYDATITIPDAKQCVLSITGIVAHHKARSFSLHIAIAPTKNIDRFEWFIEKAVEIGVDVITPLLCHRSERHVLKTDRLQKMIIATMKQAMVPYLPVLHELTDYSRFIESISGSPYNRFIAHCEESERKKLSEVVVTRTHVLLLIGPEGDFTQGEIDMALSHDFIPVSLGTNRLRTETAGIIACHTVNLLNEMQ